MDILEGATEPQRQAITHVEGPLLVLAGAGSGKTRVITRRIAHLIQQGIHPSSIVAITFTNKAAGEMKERVIQLVGDSGVWLSTFHAMCVRMLRISYNLIGQPNNFTIYDEDDRRACIKRVMKDLNLDSSSWRPGSLSAAISRAKNDLISAENYAETASSYHETTVASVYERYEETLAANNSKDFDDLLVDTVGLLSEHSDVLSYFNNKLKFILIDEFQDTNRPQYVIASMLASAHHNICATGDPDQSIYSWRGADIRNIMDFEKDFPETAVVRLEQNYRSTKSILSAASEMVKHNRLRKEKSLWTENEQGNPVKVVECADEQAEANFVAKSARDLKGEAVPYSHMAVFYRTNAQSRAVEESLRNNAIPYLLIGAVAFYQRKEIKDLIAYLRTCVNPKDTVSILRIINTPPRGIGKVAVDRLFQWTRREDVSLRDAIRRHREIVELSSAQSSRMGKFDKLLEDCSKLPHYPVANFVRQVIDVSGYLPWLAKSGDPHDKERVENIEELVSAASECDKVNPEGSLEGFLEHVALVADIDSWDKESGAISLMTIHSAKGLEFPVVFIAGLEDGLLPHSQSLETQEGLEEERRLCYVGMTRAKKELILLNARCRRHFGVLTPAMPSRFLDEIPPDIIEKIDMTELSDCVIEEIGSDGLRSGDQVLHPLFGRGRVVEMSGSGERRRAKVHFERVGTKNLVLQFAKLEKMGK